MKKCIALLLSAALGLSLTACRADVGDHTEEPSANTTSPTVQQDTTTHQHSYAKAVKASGCLTVGYTTYTCDCGDSYFRELTDPTGHSYVDSVIAPTADTQGYTEHTCSDCGDTYKDTFVDPDGTSHKHSYAASENVAPGCITIGYTMYTCNCGDSYMDDLAKAIGHSYTDVLIPPTIGAQGCTQHTCTACGDVFTDSFVEALPAPHQHQYIEAKVIAPDCVAEGCSLYRCDCGDELYGKYTAVVDHNYYSTVVAATHTTEGFTEHRCTVCDDWYRDTFVERTPEHSYVVSDVVDPTCAMEGFTLYRCDCGDFYTADHVPATGHSYAVDRVVEPTYDAQGYTVYICSGCGDTYHGDYTEKLQPEQPSNGHVCSGDYHEEIQQGGYTYVYCDTIESPYFDEDSYTVYYPYDYYF